MELPFIDQALALNTNLARAWHYSGWVRIWLGEPELAIEHLKRAMRFSPVDPWLCSVQTAIAFAYFFLDRDSDASSWAAMALRERPNFQPALRITAASNALAGMMDKAQAAVARLRELNPSLRVSNLRAIALLSAGQNFLPDMRKRWLGLGFRSNPPRDEPGASLLRTLQTLVSPALFSLAFGFRSDARAVSRDPAPTPHPSGRRRKGKLRPQAAWSRKNLEPMLVRASLQARACSAGRGIGRAGRSVHPCGRG
jgi:tetratricopeptide (TPR) repeat protein